MNELEALRWLQDQKGLQIFIGSNQMVTLHMDRFAEVTGKGFLGAVTAMQNVLREMEAVPKKEGFCSA